MERGAHHLPSKTPLDVDHVSIRPATASDKAALVEFRLAMFVEIGEAEGGLQRDLAALREANERWLDGHLGRDFGLAMLPDV